MSFPEVVRGGERDQRLARAEGRGGVRRDVGARVDDVVRGRVAKEGSDARVRLRQRGSVVWIQRSGGKWRTGSVRSATVTVNEAEPTLPELSVALQVTVVIPSDGSSSPDGGLHGTFGMFPSKSSDAVALPKLTTDPCGPFASTVMLDGDLTTGPARSGSHASPSPSPSPSCWPGFATAGQLSLSPLIPSPSASSFGSFGNGSQALPSPSPSVFSWPGFEVFGQLSVLSGTPSPSASGPFGVGSQALPSPSPSCSLGRVRGARAVVGAVRDSVAVCVGAVWCRVARVAQAVSVRVLWAGFATLGQLSVLSGRRRRLRRGRSGSGRRRCLAVAVRVLWAGFDVLGQLSVLSGTPSPSAVGARSGWGRGAGVRPCSLAGRRRLRRPFGPFDSRRCSAGSVLGQLSIRSRMPSPSVSNGIGPPLAVAASTAAAMTSGAKKKSQRRRMRYAATDVISRPIAALASTAVPTRPISSLRWATIVENELRRSVHGGSAASRAGRLRARAARCRRGAAPGERRVVGLREGGRSCQTGWAGVLPSRPEGIGRRVCLRRDRWRLFLLRLLSAGFGLWLLLVGFGLSGFCLSGLRVRRRPAAADELRRHAGAADRRRAVAAAMLDPPEGADEPPPEDDPPPPELEPPPSAEPPAAAAGASAASASTGRRLLGGGSGALSGGGAWFLDGYGRHPAVIGRGLLRMRAGANTANARPHSAATTARRHRPTVVSSPPPSRLFHIVPPFRGIDYSFGSPRSRDTTLVRGSAPGE